MAGATSPEDLGFVDPSFPLTDMMMDHSNSFHDGVAEAAPATAGPCRMANGFARHDRGVGRTIAAIVHYFEGTAARLSTRADMQSLTCTAGPTLA